MRQRQLRGSLAGGGLGFRHPGHKGRGVDQKQGVARRDFRARGEINSLQIAANPNPQIHALGGFEATGKFICFDDVAFNGGRRSNRRWSGGSGPRPARRGGIFAASSEKQQ